VVRRLSERRRLAPIKIGADGLQRFIAEAEVLTDLFDWPVPT